MKDPFKKSFFEMTPILEIGKYRISYSKDSNSIFCFVEGLADITFYKNFVINYFKDYIIEWFNCGGVFEVLNYYDLAKEQSDNWNKLNKNRFLFFTDKDCSDIQKDSNLRMQDDNIFITQDVYSVDNYLVVEYIVERILEEYFGIEKSHISILKCEFNKVYEQFKEMFSDIVCLDIESRNKNGEIRKLLEKINHNITDEKKVKGFKDIVIIDNFFELNYQRNKSTFNLIQKRKINEILGNLELSNDSFAKIVSSYKESIKGDNFKKYCRGHFEIQVLVLFFNSIHEYMKIKKLNTDFFYKLPVKKEDFNEEFIVVLAAPRAKIPDELKIFLENNYRTLTIKEQI